MLVLCDFARLGTPDAVYDYLSEELQLPSYFGRNLDALYDILTGLPHLGRSFRILLPAEDASCRGYAEIMTQVFEDAGAELVCE